jgi:hypothetical protein
MELRLPGFIQGTIGNRDAQIDELHKEPAFLEIDMLIAHSLRLSTQSVLVVLENYVRYSQLVYFLSR